MKVTSANANKLLKKLNEQKSHLLFKESSNRVYICAEGETLVIPDYSYEDTANKLADIDNKIMKIKHAVNCVNTTQTVDVNGAQLTIDCILVRMAQLNQRKATLDSMRSTEKKARLNSRAYGSSNSLIEYKYANYDIDVVAKDYESIDNEIITMQLALDKFNQTFEFEIDIEL